MTAGIDPGAARSPRARREDASAQAPHGDEERARAAHQRPEAARQAQRSDATRQALIRAARAEFAEYGLAGARVDRIAETAGVNKERIYGLFGSKDKLFDVILIESMREFLDVVRPLAQTDPGDYVADLFDYHREHPQLLRLLLWEALHRGADAHDIDGWRAAHYVRKSDSARQQFDLDEQAAGRTLLALCGLANWTLAVPQTTRLLLGDPAAADTATTREFLREFARAAMQNESIGPRGGASRRQAVNELTGNSTDAEPTSESDDPVDRAARRLREARAAAEAAREDLAVALRAAHADGTSANQLARRVHGTLSRPVVLGLLTE
ncbi:TetR/AcrR family transcriptional regulator [Nocardia bovistercoris]|uniref:TetR/AcrR family transcriptional regulator n=1 Tax=Nocardia bovistercoris TaxID=2785916 RepID=A0A931N533_9NOCA|nr:TetR family transcriptional regulator [Nocardia bovistercoris]MBH0778238.1 TetR/AcrR family transcriptional regulator [Nocardia bovistercoris]